MMGNWVAVMSTNQVSDRVKMYKSNFERNCGHLS